jgi:hypothetical protein
MRGTALVLRRRTAAVALAFAFVWLALSAAAQSSENFKARLAPVPLEASMRATVAGTGSATAVLTGTKLSVSGTFSGLKSPATTARVYQGQVIGVRGSSIFDLTVTPAASGSISGSFSGSFDLTAAQAESLRQGKFYIQIDSEKARDGNLWGWLGH